MPDTDRPEHDSEQRTGDGGGAQHPDPGEGRALGTAPDRESGDAAGAPAALPRAGDRDTTA